MMGKLWVVWVVICFMGLAPAGPLGWVIGTILLFLAVIELFIQGKDRIYDRKPKMDPRVEAWARKTGWKYDPERARQDEAERIAAYERSKMTTPPASWSSPQDMARYAQYSKNTGARVDIMEKVEIVDGQINLERTLKVTGAPIPTRSPYYEPGIVFEYPPRRR